MFNAPSKDKSEPRERQKINPRVTLAAGLARVFGYAAHMEFRAAASAHGALRIGFRLALRPSAIGLVLGVLAGCGAQGDNGTDVTVNPGNPGGGGTAGTGGAGPSGPCEDVLGCDLVDPPLEAPPGCGNGELTDDEACDDSNRDSGDGCAGDCLATEPGYSCAAPGQLCRQIARCGDGLVADTEQCDDANVANGDGCTERCRVELGKKCDGEPSVCTDAVCGNREIEGAEACDDGNTVPFDGCSPICLKEPNCAGLSCTSDCGDGLLINEECDDGNLIDGDGCSSSCTKELGFECIAEATCEQDALTGGCILRVPTIFRDFSNAHPDFGDKGACTDLVVGSVNATLNANRRPTLTGQNTAAACLSTGDNFLQWYTSIPGVNETLVGEIVLYDNNENGYVNRFGPNGEPFLGIDDSETEQRGYSPTLAGCQQVCANEAANETQCFNECDQFRQALQTTQNELNQRTNELNQAIAQANAAQIALLEPQVAQLELELAAAQAGSDTCQTTCHLRAVPERAGPILLGRYGRLARRQPAVLPGGLHHRPDLGHAAARHRDGSGPIRLEWFSGREPAVSGARGLHAQFLFHDRGSILVQVRRHDRGHAHVPRG
jgi:cysteine-rich repeat protein